MSEIITQISDGLPESLKAKYSSVTTEQNSDGSIRHYGVRIDTGGKNPISSNKLLEAYGYSPEKQAPVKGVWKSKDSDYPITINGLLGRYGREEYLRAEETSAGIPRSEVVFLSEPAAGTPGASESAPSEPITPAAFESLQARVEALASRVEELEGKLSEAEARNSQLEQEIQSLKEENKSLREGKAVSFQPAASPEFQPQENNPRLNTLAAYWQPKAGEQVFVMDSESETLKRAEVDSYDRDKDLVAVVDENGEKHEFPRLLLVSWMAGDRPRAVEREEVRQEHWTDTRRGRVLGAVALIGTVLAAGVVGYNLNKDDDKVVEKDSRELVIATQELTREQKREADIENDKLEVERDRLAEELEANEIASRLLVAERYENRLNEKENQLRLQQLRAQQYANRLAREEAERDKRQLQITEEGSEGEIETAGAQDRNTIFIEPGHGFTHEIRDIFPGYSGQQYYQAHLATLEKFGENYITQVPKYSTVNGDIRFGSPGEAILRPSVRNYIDNYLKAH